MSYYEHIDTADEQGTRSVLINIILTRDIREPPEHRYQKIYLCQRCKVPIQVGTTCIDCLNELRDYHELMEQLECQNTCKQRRKRQS